MNELDLECYNLIKIAVWKIEFSEYVEHVGLINSTAGNLPHILGRITAHNKALGATLSSGIAQKNRANPLVGIKLEKLYCTLVLMSGLSIFSSKLTMIDGHRNIQKTIS